MAQTEKVVGHKHNDSCIAEVVNLDFPSKQSRQYSKMASKDGQLSYMTAKAGVWQSLLPAYCKWFTPGIPNKSQHAQDCPATPVLHRSGNISPQQQPALFLWMPLPCSLNRHQCGVQYLSYSCTRSTDGNKQPGTRMIISE